MLETEQLRKLFAQLAIFGLVAAVWCVGVTFWWLRRRQRRQELEQRLELGDAAGDNDKVLRLWHEGQAVSVLVPGAGSPTLMVRLEQAREDAGWTTPMPTILGLVTGGALLAAALLLLLTRDILLAVAVPVMIFVVFRVHMARCTSKRAATFDRQLVDALDLGARSLRAGHPLSGAFQLIAQEIGAPLNQLFAQIVEQEALGVSLPNALRQVAQRTRAADMKVFAASVIIQLHSGGNLADMMERVAWVVRDRIRLAGHARVLSAEAQLSKWVLLALPILMFVILNVLNREYMQPLYATTPGMWLMVGAGVFLLLGAWMMNRMAQLKY